MVLEIREGGNPPNLADSLGIESLCFCLLLLLLSLFVSSRVFFMCLSSCAECRTMKSDVANTHTSACVVSRQSVLNENPARFAIFALHENNYLCYSYASTEPQKFGSFFLLMPSFIKGLLRCLFLRRSKSSTTIVQAGSVRRDDGCS